MHFQIAYFYFVFSHLELKREKRSYAPYIPRKPYPIPDQNGQSAYPFLNQKGTQTTPFGAAHTHMTYIRESPPTGFPSK